MALMGNCFPYVKDKGFRYSKHPNKPRFNTIWDFQMWPIARTMGEGEKEDDIKIDVSYSPYALKLSVVVDQHWIPHGICCHPGNRPDVCLLQDTLRSMLVDVESRPLYADKGYDSRNNRKVCHAAGVQDRIFRRRTTATRRTHACG
jgi:hypothetical protein